MYVYNSEAFGRRLVDTYPYSSILYTHVARYDRKPASNFHFSKPYLYTGAVCHRTQHSNMQLYKIIMTRVGIHFYT